MVIKPAVSSGAKGARRADVGDPAAQDHLDVLLAAGDALVQEYVPTVVSDGEWSVVLIEGDVAHSLWKRPAAGDYRVQEEWGGSTERIEADGSLAELATRVCDVLPTRPLYARVDVVLLRNRWHVMEVEVTEPSLWLQLAPETTRRLADAIGRKVSHA
jgi:glutathione synthase/RimK-type ligase-like ATP-grasp enzyme